MKIRDILAVNVASKLKKPFKIAKMVRERASSTVVTIETDEGIRGYGEATFAHFFAGETEDSARSVVTKSLAPGLIGKDPTNILSLVDQMNTAIAGNPFAKAAVEMALWDIKGKILQTPVYQLLGGYRRKRIPVNHSVSYGSIAEMTEEAVQHVSRGFKTIKIYCGRETPQDDLERIREIRRAVGDGIQIYVESNQRWSFKTTLGLLPYLEELKILFMEQPISVHLWREMKILRERSSIPVAIDEGVFNAEDVVRAKQNELADIMNIYVLKAGGILNAKRALDVTESVGLQAFIGSFNELGISIAAGAHLAATLASLPYPCYLIGPMLYEEEILQEPLDIRDGFLSLPEKPGLGIEVDEKRLKKLSGGS
jgi:L-alanine-DL-glutamate epimerase-like enolase superfamily enzyme